MRTVSVSALILTGLLATGCSNEGGQLAQASRAYAQCQLAEGTRCALAQPPGTTVEKASFTALDDAVRISGKVSRVEDCEGFAANARTDRYDYVVQGVINDTVVTPYGEMKPVPSAVDSACAKAPYRVTLTVAKAP